MCCAWQAEALVMLSKGRSEGISARLQAVASKIVVEPFQSPPPDRWWRHARMDQCIACIVQYHQYSTAVTVQCCIVTTHSQHSPSTVTVRSDCMQSQSGAIISSRPSVIYLIFYHNYDAIMIKRL